MKTINLFIMDMTNADNTSGVDRYVSTLLKGLELFSNIHVHWIHLRHDKSALFHTEENMQSFTKITIPLPQQFNEIIAERFWIRKYNEQVYRLIAELFNNKPNCILHLHTLNLIDLAIFIKDQIPCKIITHLHCIPWKGWFNTNKRKFNQLYPQVYFEKYSNIDSVKFVTNNCEVQSYTDSDHVICVTRCAVDFLKNVMNQPVDNLSIIPNGIDDFFEQGFSKKENNNKVFKLLYVGVLSESKGLGYILKALRIVKELGYEVSLSIAGKVAPNLENRLKVENRDLSLNVLGRISFDDLKKQYNECDAGIIASLQEQSSYVAIEMAMFGLPVITTAVDRLDEIFTDNVNALKVNTCFSKVTGLTVDVDMMAYKIISLIEDEELRASLSENIRQLYKKELTLERMLQQTVSVYQKMIGEMSHE